MFDTKYQYSEVGIEFVMANPEEYIIPGNLEACKLLWSKNIFTRMCNNYDNEDSWITLGELSDENDAIFKSLEKTNPCVGHTWGGRGFTIPVKPGNDAFSSFSKIISLFKTQDIQKDGCMDYETFMTFYTPCYKVIPNPKKVVCEKPNFKDFPDTVEGTILYSRAYDEYVDSALVPSTIRVFDKSKMQGSVEDYINQSQFATFYDSDLKKVYYSKFFYDAHNRYKESLKENKKN